METTTTKRNGRPPKKVNEKRTYFYAVRLTPVEKKVVEDLAKDCGISITKLFRKMMYEYVNKDLIKKL